MKTKLIKEIMVPLERYVKVKKEDSLYDVIQALEKSKVANSGRVHRDAVMVDGDGKFIGKVTMIDIFRALEPNYKKVNVDEIVEGGKGELTEEIITAAYKDFNFWVEPSKTICERGLAKKVSEVMHLPADRE